MALGPQFFRDKYSNLSVDELKKEYKKENSFFIKLMCKILDLINKADDNSSISDNEICLEVLRELIKEKGGSKDMRKKKSIELSIIIFIVFILIILLIVSIKKIIYEINYANKIDSILADTVEIEKKWIIDKEKIPYNLSNAEIIEIEQTYLCFSPEIRVRKIDGGKEYTFAVKTNITSDGITRDEFEDNITEEEYNNLIKKQEGNTIRKTRYQFLDGEYLLAIDIFSGELEGLAYLEIEFENQEEADKFKTPEWTIKDVTSDLNYKNGHLARFGIPESYFEYIK